MNRWVFYLLILLSFVAESKWAEASGERNKAHSSLSFEVNYVYRKAGVGELKTINNGDSLQSGDHYKIVFNPDKDCYVYIFQVDSSGQVFQLFPMDNFRGVRVNNLNPVRHGKTYVLPSPDKAFVLDQMVGVERIYFIASNGQDEELEGLYAELKKDTNRKSPIQTEDARNKLNKYFRRRGIEVVPSEQSMEVPWRETGDLFSIMAGRLENLQSDTVQVLEFAHK